MTQEPWIRFGEISISSNDKLLVPYADESGANVIWFSVPPGYKVDPDLVAISLTTLLGSAYKCVEFTDALREHTHALVARLTSASVRGPLAADSDHQRNTTANVFALNFSGGFDSLAALTLSPPETKLISMDFGQRFSRERRFFEKFSPIIVETNFRELGFAKNTWAFMGIGALLMRDHLGLSTYGFGSILEASPIHFSPKTRTGNVRQPWFQEAGLTLFNPVFGLTEVGTVMAIVASRPELAIDSLESLADPRSEKYYRKLLLLHAASRRFRHLDKLPDPQEHAGPYFEFGQSFANDFLIFYILKVLGNEAAEGLVANLPPQVAKVSETHGLTFYERVNTNFYNHLPRARFNDFYTGCRNVGILPYTRSDWVELEDVMSLLSQYHSSLEHVL